MNSFFRSIAGLVSRHPWWVIVIMTVLVITAGFLGKDVSGRLSSGGFVNEKSDSYQVAVILGKTFHQIQPNVVLLVTAKDKNVDSVVSKTAAGDVEAKLKAVDHMTNVFSYWSNPEAQALKSKDGSQALILGTQTGGNGSERIKKITEQFSAIKGDVTVGVAGGLEINRQFNHQIESDLKFAEVLAIPVTLILLLLVFRSVVAALLPLIIGGFSIVGTLFVLDTMTHVTDVSVYAMNLTTMLGLGLAIDYSLFVVSRFREQMAAGAKVSDAVQQTVRSAGRTTVFSALTVAVSLSALIVFPLPFLRSFTYAGVAVAVVSALGSLFLLPAILQVLGTKVNAWAISKNVHLAQDSRFWKRIAEFVMQRPWRVLIMAVALLLVAGYPFTKIHLGQGDERGLPEKNPVRIIQQQIRHNFSSEESSAATIISQSANITGEQIDSYAKLLSNVKHADHVETATGLYVHGQQVKPDSFQLLSKEGTIIAVVPDIEPLSLEGEQFARDIRAVRPPFPVLVGGQSASLVDTKTSLIDKLPEALAIISGATFILLFLMFGSLLVPLKALVINFLSMSATFGLMVWIFQEGHLANLLHFTPTGLIDASMPVLMFCIAFGTSMDYEVFLLSRIKEHYDATHQNRDSVAHGLEKTGGIVTAAAMSISVVFLAFATSGVMLIKLMGLGLATAVLLDAFIIRGTLVPAFMRLAGNANWWLPGFLKAVYHRLKLSETE